MLRFAVLCSAVPCRPVSCRAALRCAVLCYAVLRCAVLCCAVPCCASLSCAVPKALLPGCNGRNVYPRVQVNGRGCVCGVCAVCKCVVAQQASAHFHLAGNALPMPVRSRTGSDWSTAPCVPRYTITDFCAVPHCLVPCTALHCVCPAAMLLWARGSWQCSALPRHLEAVGSGTRASHCHIAWGQWVVEHVQCSASLPGGSGYCILPQYTASPPRGSRQWNSYSTLPLSPGAVGSCAPVTLPHCLGALGSGTSVIHRLTAWGQRALDPLQYTASLRGCSGQCNSLIVLPRCSGHWAVLVVHRAFSLPWDGGQWDSCYPRRTALGQWKVELLHCTASTPGGGGQRILCNALSHCRGAVGSGTPAMHCLTAQGQWAMGLQCTTTLLKRSR